MGRLRVACVVLAGCLLAVCTGCAGKEGPAAGKKNSRGSARDVKTTSDGKTEKGGPAEDKAKPEALPAPQEEKDAKVGSDELAREFARDAKKAAGKYRNQWIVVVGPLAERTPASFGGVRVQFPEAVLDRAKRLSGPRVRITCDRASAKQLLSLTRGQTVEVRGLFRGAADGTIDLEEGTVVSTGPDSAVAVSADSLTKEYAGDRKTAETKYAGKELLVAGTVVAVQEDREGRRVVLLAGFNEKAGKPTRVEAVYPLEWKSVLAVPKTGAKVQLKGTFVARGDQVSLGNAFLMP